MVTATATETQVPPTATPEPETAWIELNRRTDPLTDKVSVGFVSPTSDHNLESPWADREVALYIRCDGDIQVFIHWGGQYMAASKDVFSGQLRWDDGEVAQARWSESADNEATFLERRQTEVFMNETKKANKLFVRIVDYSAERHDALFQVDGLTAHLEANADLCGTTITAKASTPTPTSSLSLTRIDEWEGEGGDGVSAKEVLLPCTLTGRHLFTTTLDSDGYIKVVLEDVDGNRELIASKARGQPIQSYDVVDIADARFDAGPCVIEVSATGAWAITMETYAAPTPTATQTP